MAQQHFLFSARLIEKLPSLRNISWRLEAFVVRSLLKLMQSMTPERAARFANFVFRNLRFALPFTSKIRRNLSVAFPRKDQRELRRLTREVCGNLGNAAAELVFAERIWLERDRRIEFVVKDGVNLTDYRDNAAVMVTGHIGAWQIASFVASQYELRITSIFAPEKNPFLADLFLQLRAALPCRFISRDGCMRGLTQELKQKHIVGMVTDTRLDSGDPLDFFDVPTPTNTTAARLALRHHCDLLPVRAERLNDMRFRITVFPPIRSDDPAASANEQAHQMTQQLLAYFERWIRETPDQWMCFGRRWPHEAYADIETRARRAD